MTPTIRQLLEPKIRAHGVRKCAHAAGMAQSNLSRWLAGGAALKDHQIDAICRELGVTLRAIRGRRIRGRRRR